MLVAYVPPDGREFVEKLVMVPSSARCSAALKFFFSHTFSAS